MWLFIDFNVNVLTVRPKSNFDLVGVINGLKSLRRFVPKTVIVQYPQLSLLNEIWNIGSNSYGKRV